MIYSRLADLVVLLHFLFILFVIFGALLSFKWRWVAWIQIPAVVWAIYIEFLGKICPLTPLENSLRLKSGNSSYHEGFIQHYILPVIYPPGISREIQLLLGCIVLLLNIAIYWYLFGYKRKNLHD